MIQPIERVRVCLQLTLWHEKQSDRQSSTHWCCHGNPSAHRGRTEAETWQNTSTLTLKSSFIFYKVQSQNLFPRHHWSEQMILLTLNTEIIHRAQPAEKRCELWLAFDKFVVPIHSVNFLVLHVWASIRVKLLIWSHPGTSDLEVVATHQRACHYQTNSSETSGLTLWTVNRTLTLLLSS